MGLKKGYKQTEVGVIPEDWEVRAINTVSKLINGRGFKPFEWKSDGLPIIRIQNLNGAEEFNYFQGVYDKKIEVDSGQLLFAWSGSRGTSFGPHIWLGPRGLLNYHTWKVQIDEREIDKDFYFYSLRKLTAFIEGEAHGAAALVHVQKWQMEDFEFPLPHTKAEQKAIAEALNDASALIESLEQLLAKKRNLKQGAMQELLTGKKRLPGFNGKWIAKTLGDLFNFTGGFTASRDQLSSEGYCYLHYGDIHASKKMFVDVRSEFQEIPKLDVPLKKVSCASLLSDGDVVFVDASEDDEGTSRHIVVVNPDGIPFISGLHTIVAKGKANDLEHRYRGYCFQTPAVKNQFKFFAVGTKVSGISKSNIAKITLPIPSVPEQIAIAAILSDMDTEIATLETKLTKCRQLKTGMMQELLTGRIRLV